MARCKAVVDASPDAVWQVLADPHSYQDWVVGAKRIRAVEGAWPEVGSQFHHEVGIGPLYLKDRTSVVAVEPGRSITLRARARPAGIAEVVITLTPDERGTRVDMFERPVEGLAKRLNNPLQELSIRRRNVATLKRLGRLAAARSRGVTGA